MGPFDDVLIEKKVLLRYTFKFHIILQFQIFC